MSVGSEATELIPSSRRRKTKCDGVQPRCRYCASRDLPCHWPANTANTPSSPVGRHVFTLPAADGSIADASTRELGGSPAESSPRMIAENVLPSTAALEKCLAIFFEGHFEVDFCSFFHRPSFEATAPTNRFLVTSIVSLCARYLTADEARLYFDSPSQRDVYRHFTKVAKRMARESSDLPSGRMLG